MKKDDPLQKLKERLIELQTGNLNVEADNPNIVRCWERLQCERKDCPAYGKLRCWSIVGTLCHDVVRGKTAQELGDCHKCVVYRESCRDEPSELLEIFNQTVKDLKFSFSEAAREKARLERFSGLEEMAGTVAHEARNPLHAIGLATAYLKRHYHDKVITDFLVIIDEELQRLNEIIDGFLAFANPAPFITAEHQLGELAEEVIRSFTPECRTRGVTIRLKQEDVPPFICDDNKIKEVFYQLLSNSLEASSGGQTITVRLERERDGISLRVKDEGSGISKQNVDLVMNPFFTTKTRGPGLGLALVDRIVHQHGGRTSISSQPGVGTEVSVWLPIGKK
ncbi:MAG: ATP-binding protein [Deltaproteobacteria bacterium]